MQHQESTVHRESFRYTDEQIADIAFRAIRFKCAIRYHAEQPLSENFKGIHVIPVFTVLHGEEYQRIEVFDPTIMMWIDGIQNWMFKYVVDPRKSPVVTNNTDIALDYFTGRRAIIHTQRVGFPNEVTEKGEIVSLEYFEHGYPYYFDIFEQRFSHNICKATIRREDSSLFTWSSARSDSSFIEVF
jgi:hypothetical protein